MPNTIQTKKSDDYFQAALEVTPGGTQTLSKAPTRYVNGVYPKMLDYGEDGHVWDYDGVEYIDYIAGLGALSVGYVNKAVNSEVIKQMGRGTVFSLPHKLEGDVARRLAELVPSMEMSKFTKTGSDACTMAVKCARAFTGREKVMVCGYHGWMDWYSIVNDKKAGIPAFNATLATKARYNNLHSFSDLSQNRYACVIMEPMVLEYPNAGFLEAVQSLCKESGTLLIFDEVVTGGRFSPFTTQDHFGVRPDLTVLSKGIANGMPLAVVGGRRDVMKTFERDDFFVSTTFGGECLSLAACLATLDVLKKEIPSMIEKGSRIKAAFEKVFEGQAFCIGYPTRTQFDFPNVPLKALFWQECCKRGVLFGYNNFVMASHTDEDIEETRRVINEAATVVKNFWEDPLSKLEGDVPVEALRLR